MHKLIVLAGIVAALLAGGCSTAVKPRMIGDRASSSGHPFLLFSASDIPSLRARENADPMLKICMADIRDAAAKKSGNKGFGWIETLETRSLLAALENDPAKTKAAIEYFEWALDQYTPEEYFAKIKSNWYGAPLRAIGLAWDWLEPSMTAEQKGRILPRVRAWCVQGFAYTEKQWWRDASYNVGAEPVSGNGLLALSILRDCNDPAVEHCYQEIVRRIGQNYFPLVWRPSGICYEGPGYAKAGLNQAIIFAQAVLRSGGPDLTAGSGASKAMQYLMYQYMPWGGDAPIGDNTDFGGHTFVGQYLLGLGKTGDEAGLWTWKNYTKIHWSDVVISYLWYPVGLTAREPKELALPTSRYFPVTTDRAGYVFSRSAWNDRNSAFFAFTTRYEQCNHQHYDMDSFLFGGFGTLFATHELLFPYSSEHHGVDHEHNMVVIDGGGWPAHNGDNHSCAIDNSHEGLLVGMSLGNFADYVRGDAKGSYHDNSLPTSELAVRAERSCLFVKQGSTPYVLIVDDNQQTGSEHKYDWLWHAPVLPMHGTGTLADPMVMTAKNGSCALQFITPAIPGPTTQKVIAEIDKKKPTTTTAPSTTSASAAGSEGEEPVKKPSTPAPAWPVTRPVEEVLATTAPATSPATHPTTAAAKKEHRPPPQTEIDVQQTGVRVHFAAIASVQGNESERPRISVLKTECTNPSASAVKVELADRSHDVIAWQSEEDRVQSGYPLSVGELQTDGLMAMVRLNAEGKIIGFVLGEGTYLRYGDRWLVKAERSVSVSAGAGDRQISGRLRTRQGLPPEDAGHVRVAATAEK